jgi:RimJ/RimL family protein N-acetyltransferase
VRRANPRAEDVLRNLPTLETDRLILRKMTLNDAEAVFAYASDPEVTRYVSWETHRKIGDSESFLRSVLGGYEKGEAAEWGIVYKGDGRFVGGCGVVRWELDHSRAELGYVLSPGSIGDGAPDARGRASHGLFRFREDRPQPRRGALHRREHRLGEGSRVQNRPSSGSAPC